MDFYHIVSSLFIFIFIFIVFANRIRQLRVIEGLTPVEGVIIGSQFRLNGESAIVYVDVKYHFNEVEHYAYDLNTSSITDSKFQIGSAITVVVDASNPWECHVKRSQIGDRLLRSVAGMLISPNK